MFRGFAIRDLTLLGVTLVLWALTVQLGSESPLGLAIAIAAGVGAMICAYNFHEWGHLLAARMTDSVFTPAKRLISPFLFAYDDKENTKRQFILMSLGGFAATAVFIVVFVVFIPQDVLAGRIAVRGAIVLASLTVIIEFPIFFRALLGTTLPRTGVFTGPTVGGQKRTQPSDAGKPTP